MKPKIPNQKKAYDALNLRLIKYMSQVMSIYDRIANQIAIAVDGTNYDGSVEFLFRDYPELNQTVKNLMSDYAGQMNNLIYSGTTKEWQESNIMQDLLARKVLRAYDFEKGGDKYQRYFQPNTDALKAFQQRVDRGMNLSQKLWVQSQALKKEIEQTISTAIDRGQSAVVLSKRISKYLSDYPSMKADYAEKYGKAVSCLDCQYTSIRLARTEINMAYRKAEQIRWKQFDFILGYEIKLSKRHPAPDICDDLLGIYPKDFVFVGWHPNCMCYVIPIVMSDEEYYTPKQSLNSYKPLPSGLGSWIDKNCLSVLSSSRRKTLPYWLRDNKSVRDCAILIGKARERGDDFKKIGETIAEKVGGIVTPVNYKSFSSMYRKLITENIDITDIKDALRSTIIVDKDKLEEVVFNLKHLDIFLRHKEQKDEMFNGYSGNIINLSMPNNIVAEIQVNTAKMIYAKETESNAKRILGEELWNKIRSETNLQGGLGHKYYEEIRLLNKVTDLPRIERLKRFSEEYYSHFR